MTTYETFCDRSYYDLWAVRTVGERRWGHCYHLNSKEEADGLVEELTGLHQEIEQLKSVANENVTSARIISSENVEHSVPISRECGFIIERSQNLGK